MYDRDILSHDYVECKHCMACLDKIGSLAVQCLKEDVDERPTMAEVVDELKEAAEVVDACKHQRNFTDFGGSSFEVSYSYKGRRTSVKKAMQHGMLSTS
jgi:hypothetical protein